MAATRGGGPDLQWGGVQGSADSPDRLWGEHVWVGCQGGSICSFDTRTLELWAMLPGHTQDVMAMTRVPAPDHSESFLEISRNVQLVYPCNHTFE
jgi:hypothetical protein